MVSGREWPIRGSPEPVRQQPGAAWSQSPLQAPAAQKGPGQLRTETEQKELVHSHLHGLSHRSPTGLHSKVGCGSTLQVRNKAQGGQKTAEGVKN
jgi:hypothetical protein